MADKVLSGVGWTTISSIIRNVVSLAQIAILTRFLDKADFGIVAIANIFVGFTTLFLDMGISAGIIHRQRISNKEYSSLFWFNVLLGLVLTLSLYFFAPFFTSKYESEDLTTIVRLIGITIFISSLGTQQRAFCQKKSFFKRLSVIEILGYITTFSVALVTVINGFGVFSLAYSTLAGSIVLNITHLIIAIVKDNRLSFHFSLKDTQPFLKIGVYQVGSSILDFFTRELDILIISATIGLEFLGVYDIAKRIPTSLFSFILPIVNRVFPPILAEVNDKKKILKSTYMRLAKVMSWISFPMYMLIASLSPTILTIVFGPEYIEGVYIMILFSVKYAFSGTNTICGALQVATGRTDIGLKWTIYSVISTGIIYYVSAQYGITSFMVGMCLLILANVSVLWLIQFKPMTHVSWNEYLSIFNRSLFICLPLSTIIYFVYHQSSIVYSIGASFIFIILYIFLLMNSRDGDSLLDMIDSVPLPLLVKQFFHTIKMVK